MYLAQLKSKNAKSENECPPGKDFQMLDLKEEEMRQFPPKIITIL